MKRLGKKARLRLSAIEHWYLRKYGIMPDYHYHRLRQDGKSCEEAGKIINDNVNICYKEMRAVWDKDMAAENPFLSQENNALT